jgi:hypothetical protein
VNYFSGSIDAVGILSVALSNMDVESLFSGGQSFNLNYNHDGYSGANDLEAFYPVKLMSGATLSDASGNGHDGNISGADWDGDLIPSPDWLAVSDSYSWLEAGESDQISITVITDELENDTTYFGHVLVLTNGDVTSIPVHLNTFDNLSAGVSQLPRKFKLYPAYPNPFNPVTTLHYDLPEDALVNITIYDMMGRIINNLVNSTQNSGYKSVQWNANNSAGLPVSAGMYFYSIQAGDFKQIKKIVLLK